MGERPGVSCDATWGGGGGKGKGRWGGESRVFERAERGSGARGRGPALRRGNKGTPMSV